MKIDISKKVLEHIKKDKLSIKPRWYFVLAKLASVLAVSVLAVYLFLVTTGLSFISKNQTFLDYLTFGVRGVLHFLVALPWLAIVMFFGIISLIIMLVKNYEFIYKHRYLPATLMLLLLVFGGGAFGMVGREDSFQSKIANAIEFGPYKSVQLSGRVASISDNSLVIVDTSGVKNNVEIDKKTYFKNGRPELGDNALVIGQSGDDKTIAELIKITKKAEKKKIDNGEVKGESTSSSKQDDKPTQSTSILAPKNIASGTPSSKQNSTPAPTPTPTPPPVSKTITIISTVGPMTTSSYYKVKWTTNFVSSLGFKLVWSKSHNPVYPGDQYNYYSDPNTRIGQVNNTLGSGPYYVRVCEYLGGSCGVYSNEVQVIFP